ncbi:hypothetical protein RU93_GL000228 [Enterococcus aquimarinus]|uniref:Uncharacterized protein n=1 Tax=Enterococcus aquimarinus TaxID=328396 RepID=A0A1L8QXS2_9ENTE|nr:hypothetical protein RU93_GL000228 [Enterococcus aquimarinus]
MSAFNFLRIFLFFEKIKDEDGLLIEKGCQSPFPIDTMIEKERGG